MCHVDTEGKETMTKATRALRGGGSLNPSKGFVLTLCVLGAFLRAKLSTVTSTAEWVTCASC